MALVARGNNITIAKGNQIELCITPYISVPGYPYKLAEGEKMVVSVHQYKDYDPVIKAESDVQSEDGSVNFILSSEDTNIPRGSYCWMASIADSAGNIIDTFIGGLEYAAFYVK